MKSNLLTWLAQSKMSDHQIYQAQSIWLQLVRLLVEEGQCDPTTAHYGITNFIMHHWYGPMETLVLLCRQDQLWFEIPVNGGLGHTYHLLAKDIWGRGPSILLNVFWTEERVPYILHSKDHDSRTVLYAAVERQACWANIASRSSRPNYDSSFDRLVTRLIQDGSDVHALDLSGSTPLNNALWQFAIYCDSSPLKALDFAHETREVFRIERKQRKNRMPGSQSGSEADLDGSTGSKWRFRQFLSWWFERLDDSGYNFNDYVRHENLQPPMCKIGRDDAVFGAQISKTLHYDETAQTLELDVKWAWTKIGGSEELRDLGFSILPEESRELRFYI